MATIITTLNPNMKRSDNRGLEVGVDYQRRCMDRWTGAGARVVSINTFEEIELLRRQGYPVELVPVLATSFMPGMRPLPSLSSAIEAARQIGNDIVIFANSDILFSAGRDRFQEIMRQIDSDDFLFASRYDVPEIDSTIGINNPYGYDVFAFHSDKASIFDGVDYNFGCPWWDYWMPINALFGGLNLKRMESDDFRHPEHHQNWNFAHWNFGAGIFLRKLQSQLGQFEGVRDPRDFAMEFSKFLFTALPDTIQEAAKAGRQDQDEIGLAVYSYARMMLRVQTSLIS
jgi:hypothetical protein